MTAAAKMIEHAIESFRTNGKLDTFELDRILELAMQDGKLDTDEKKALMSILFSLTSADFTPDLWSRVEQVIQRFGLDR